MKLGSIIRAYREADGIPLNIFAERVKISTEQLREIESNRANITDFILLLRICENLNVKNNGMRLEELLDVNPHGFQNKLPMSIPKYVAKYIESCIKKSGLTRREVGRRCGVSAQTISNIIHQKYCSSPVILQNLISLFNIRSVDLSNYITLSLKEQERVVQNDIAIKSENKEEPPKQENAKHDLSETLFRLDDIVKLSKAMKIYDNVDMVIEQIDKTIGTLNFIKTLLKEA